MIHSISPICASPLPPEIAYPDKFAKNYYLMIKRICQNESGLPNFKIEDIKRLQPYTAAGRCYKELALICYEYYLLTQVECGYENFSQLATRIPPDLKDEAEFVKNMVSRVN